LAALKGTFPEIFTWPNQNQSEDDTTSNKINHHLPFSATTTSAAKIFAKESGSLE